MILVGDNLAKVIFNLIITLSKPPNSTENLSLHADRQKHNSVSAVETSMEVMLNCKNEHLFDSTHAHF